MVDSPERLIGGRYLLAEEIGRGGMGVVWRARDQVLQRPVALKEVALPPWVGERERELAYRRVLQEARTAAMLRHPHVVTVHDVVLDRGRPWIVMELLSAESLEAVVQRKGPLPEAEVAGIGAKVLEALRAAHAAGVTHRDVKPANVLLLDGGGVVLTDFGIARVADSPTLTATGMLMGSPAYLAPERLEGNGATPGSDLWALGATLYTAVEGAPPYVRQSPVAVMAAILMGPPEPMRRARLLRPIIEGLMRGDPAARSGHDEAAAGLARLSSPSSRAEPRAREGSAALAALVEDPPD